MSTKRGSKVALPALPACVAVKTLNVPAVQIESLGLHFQHVPTVSAEDALTWTTCYFHTSPQWHSGICGFFMPGKR